MDALIQDLRYALRSLRKSPGFTAGALTILALGIAASVAVFTLINAYLIRPLPYPDADRIAAVLPSPSRTDFNIPQGLERADWSGLGSVFESVAAWDLDGFTVVDGERSDYVDGAWVSPGFFGVVGNRLKMGRVFDSAEAASGARVAVVSHAFWQRHFAGSLDVIGKTVRAYSTDRPLEPDLFTVIGVLPDNFWHISRFTDLLVPLAGPRTPSLVRIRPGVTVAEAERRINDVIKPQMPQAAAGWGLRLSPLQDEYSFEARPAVLALLGASGVLLLIACVNVAGLLLIRRSERSREWLMRAALGAGRWRLGLGSALEGLLLSLVAGVSGVLLASWGVEFFAGTIQQQLGVPLPGGNQALHLDWRVLGFGLLVTIILGGLFGARFGLSRPSVDVASALRGGGSRSGSNAASLIQRRLLVATQIALSFALLVGAGLMLRTAWHINEVPLGFDPERVIKAHVLLPRARYADGPSRVRALDEVQARLAQIPGVQAVALGFPHPFRGDGAGSPLMVQGAALDSSRAVHHTVSPRYLDVMGIRLVEGRGFNQQDRAESEPVVVVSARLARELWPAQSAIGHRIRIGARDSQEPWRTIVGVAGDVRKTITGQLFGDTYVPYVQNPRAYIGLMVRASNVNQASEAVARATVEVAPDLPLSEIEPMTDVVARAGSRQRFLSHLIASAAGFALLLSLTGIYVVLSAAVAQRRRELAVRVAVGASGTDIVRLVGREVGWLTVSGVAAGMIVSVVATRALQSQLFGVSSTDLLSYLAAGLVFAVISCIAAAIPARRAMRLDPVLVLRND